MDGSNFESYNHLNKADHELPHYTKTSGINYSSNIGKFLFIQITKSIFIIFVYFQGIIPRFISKLFEEINNLRKKENKYEYEIRVSFMQIYNEVVNYIYITKIKNNQ